MAESTYQTFVHDARGPIARSVQKVLDRRGIRLSQEEIITAAIAASVEDYHNELTVMSSVVKFFESLDKGVKHAERDSDPPRGQVQ